MTVCDNEVSGAGDTGCVSTKDTPASSGESSGSAPAASTQPAPSEEADTEPLAGNQVNPTVHAPIEICGNAVAVLDDTSAKCEPKGDDGTSEDNTTNGEGGFISGNQINPVVNAPITVCGNSVAVLGEASAECEPSDQGTNTGDNSTSGEDGVISGNQLNPVINAPITVCGNSIAVLGEASAKCKPSGQGATTGDNTTSGEDGVISGNQLNPLVNAPVTVCGNGIAVLGEASAKCKPSGQGATTGDNTTSGENGNGSGNQINPVVNAPITVCGNAIGGDVTASCAPGGQGATPGGNDTSGENGNGSGNQINPVVDAPVTVCGNAVAVLGDASAICENRGGQEVTPPPDDGDGDGNGPGSGNEVNPDVNTPVEVCGNAVGVGGDASAECVGGGATPPGPPGPPQTPPSPPQTPPGPPQAPPAPGAPVAPPAAGLPVTGVDDLAGTGLIGLALVFGGLLLMRLGRRRATVAGR